MTKEASRIVRTYEVWTDYRAGGQEQESTKFTVEAEGRVQAQTMGLSLFTEWVRYNRERGYANLADVEVIRVRCTFVGSRKA